MQYYQDWEIVGSIVVNIGKTNIAKSVKWRACIEVDMAYMTNNKWTACSKSKVCIFMVIRKYLTI